MRSVSPSRLNQAAWSSGALTTTTRSSLSSRRVRAFRSPAGLSLALTSHMPGITLTTRGKALAAGAEGDTIDVLNPHSKRVLQATVRGPGTVVVGRGRTVTAAATTSGAIR